MSTTYRAASRTAALEPRVLESLLKEKISELVAQPEFQWRDDRANYALDADGTPAARVALANCELSYDIWKNLRNPAKVGLYPVGFPEIWDFYANNRKRKTDESGRATIFQVAETYEKAKERFGRAVIISAMLPAHPDVFASYNRYITQGSFAPWEGYCKAWDDLNRLIDKGITRLAFDVVGPERVVVVMNSDNVARISKEAVPVFRQGASHGVCKGGNYPQKSIAVMTGLAQFGVSRGVFRDEIEDGEVRRLAGPVLSMIVFDSDEPYSSPGDEVLLLTEEWRRRVAEITDFTSDTSELNAYRFCTFIAEPGESGCSQCVSSCPSGAMLKSTPTADGGYPDTVAKQQHRFWQGALQFDNGSCLDYRQQMAGLYGEWMCGRCFSICGGNGQTRRSAAEGFRDLKFGAVP
jgi:hypothetical protein